MRRLTAAVVGLAAALAASVALIDALPPVGTIIGPLIAITSSAAFVALMRRWFVRPLRLITESIAPAAAHARRAEDIARAVAAEHRALVERLEQAADHGRRREAALAYTSDAVLIVIDDGQVEYANPTARMFLQDRVLEVTNKLSQPDLNHVVDLATSTGQAVAEDVILWVPGAKPARARAIPLADGATVLLLSDLSESYRLDRVRRDFVANVSHELKTPVAAVRALAETAGTALQTDDLETARRFVERLGTESARLADLVADLLDLSRVEAGGELLLSLVDLDALMVEAAALGKVVGEVRGIEIVVHETDVHIEADVSQLAMAVKNLVDNAVRYSEGGKVELAAEEVGDLVKITVTDQGIGIPSDEVSRIFERFYRVDKGRSRVTGGTGLGLAIVRHVIENHGGRVAVESELGVGSTFTITMPTRAGGPGRAAR
jgi:two-component system, OmpR family, sensor histidine kinase SenX3